MRRLSAIFLRTALLLSCLLSANSFAEPMLNGLSVHSELGKEQFIAGLYSSTLTNNAKAILLDTGDKRIEVRIVADKLSARRFKRLWIEGIAINASPKELAMHSQNMATFSNFLKVNLQAGDIFNVEKNNGSMNVSLNNTKLGTISDSKFFDILLRTWIGPVPLSSDFRQNLLTSGELDGDVESRYKSTKPSSERSRAIAENTRRREEKAQTASVESASDSDEDASALAPAITKEVADIKTITPPKPKLKPDPTPKPKPVEIAKVAKPKPARGLLDESLLDEEEGDIEFTAAGVLAESLYISQLKRWTNKHISYPNRALDKGWEGNVRLLITIDRNGEVQKTTVTEKPKYRDLEKAALKAVKKASPYPAMPQEVRGENFRFSIPIVFVLR